MSVLYKLESFEGPLDLLLHLIEKEEVDIYDIPIARITDQYMAYMAELQVFELESASEFLVMAATLLAIKSRMLLPKPPAVELGFEEEDDIDPRDALIQRLIEYRKYKAIAEELRDKELARSLIYSREPIDLTPFLPEMPDNPVEGMTPSDLLLAFRRVMIRAQRRNSTARIQRDEISVKERIGQVLSVLRKRKGKVLFSKLLDHDYDRELVVVTFLALLELMKNRLVSCYQHKLFEDIVIEYKGKEDEPADEPIWADKIDY
jgi:segregation and condensation protein A